MNPETAGFVEVPIVITAVLRLDLDEWNGSKDVGRPEDDAETLARYVCETFVIAEFADADAAFPGQSEIETRGVAVVEWP